MSIIYLQFCIAFALLHRLCSLHGTVAVLTDASVALSSLPPSACLLLTVDTGHCVTCVTEPDWHWTWYSQRRKLLCGRIVSELAYYCTAVVSLSLITLVVLKLLHLHKHWLFLSIARLTPDRPRLGRTWGGSTGTDRYCYTATVKGLKCTVNLRMYNWLVI